MTNGNLEKNVFRQELLEEALKMNMMRTFTMPIFKEMNNINLFPLWKSSSLTGSIST
jgi:hypothetical protein